MRRRSVLAAVVAGALAGCATSDNDQTHVATTPEAPSSVPDTPGNDWERPGSRPAWERAADRRIDEHRRTELTVAADAGVEVEVAMIAPAYQFSTAYNVARHRALPDGHPYREWVGRLFTDAVFENAYKWRRWLQPGTHEEMHDVMTFLRERGVRVSGAPVVWQRRTEDVVPERMWDAVDAGRPDRVAALVDDHVRDLVGHWVGDHGVTEWVLVNEPLDANALARTIAPGDERTSPTPLREWFRVANDAAPNGRYGVNEYDILAKDRPAYRDDYAALVKYLANGDAPPDEVAFQGHTLGMEETVSSPELVARLDRFAGLGDHDLVVSEFDTPGFSSEQVAGDYLYWFLKTVYSHPDTVSFRLWGYWDGQHWRDDAPLFRADFSKKPGYHAYANLVFDQWWTHETGALTDGAFSTTADLGRYRLTVRGDDWERHVVANVTDPTGVTVRVPTP